jgi:hypothetical protein
MRGMLKKVSNKAAVKPTPQAYPLGYVEDVGEPRTQLGKGRVSAAWVGGCNGTFFSIPT